MKQRKEILSWHSLRVIVSGGGTGGHIFPALAIADRIKAEAREASILFVGAMGRMEMQKVPAAGYEIKGLWISGLQRRLTLSNLLFPFKVLKSILDARRIVKEFNPDVVIGVGGYASGPTLFAATMARIPTVIQEQNSYPGITNRMLAKRVDRICVAYDGLEKYFPRDKIYLTGNPVRKEISEFADASEEAFRHFRLDPAKPVVLFVGGSLGARTINRSVSAIIDDLATGGVQVIWQTGRSFYQQALALHGHMESSGIRIFEFINEMNYAYSVATVVVSRAGAIAVSELVQVGKPAILIPSPNVAEDHQTKNAMALVNHGAAIMVKDADADRRLGAVLQKLLNDGDRRQKLRENMVKLAVKDATGDIVSVIFQLLHERSGK